MESKQKTGLEALFDWRTISPLWIVGIVVVLAVLLYCVASYDSDDKRAIRVGRANYEAMFQKALKDPTSFVLYEERFSVDSSGDVHWVLDVGAANGFGGMTRKTYRLRTDGIGGHVYNEDDGDPSFFLFNANRGVFVTNE